MVATIDFIVLWVCQFFFLSKLNFRYLLLFQFMVVCKPNFMSSKIVQLNISEVFVSLITLLNLTEPLAF
jgi:hypothetical protein